MTKFHYTIWFEAGSKLVADRFEAGRRPASKLSATSFEPALNQRAWWNLALTTKPKYEVFLQND